MTAPVRPSDDLYAEYQRTGSGGSSPAGSDLLAEYQQHTPTPKNVGVVTSGPLQPLGVDVEDIAKATSEGPLASRINANLQVAKNPDLARAVQPRARRMQAPGTLYTAADLAAGNMLAPISERAADAATEGSLERYAEGGGNPGAHANLFGAAAALGAVGGNTLLAGTGRAAASVGAKAIAEAPVATTALGRIGSGALHAGLTNAAIGAGGEAIFGDEEGHRTLGHIAQTAAVQGAVGAGLGAGLGGLSEGVGALAKRFRPENPFVGTDAPLSHEVPVVPGKVLAQRNAVTPPLEVAKDVAHEEAPDAVKQNLPTLAPHVAPNVAEPPPASADASDLLTEYRHSGPSLVPQQVKAIKTAYRQLMVTPYAKIEGAHPELAQALNTAGAASQAAQHIALRRTGWVTEGLSDDQQRAFTNVLLRDTNLAKAQSATARGETDAAQRFTQMAADNNANVPQGTEHESWFQSALDKHKEFVGQPLENAAGRAGVGSILPVQSAYLRGVSQDRLDNQEIRKAMDARATTTPSDVQPRGPVARAILGERPAVARLQRASGGIPQGPLNPDLPTQPTGAPPRSRGASISGSAKGAQGTAREYVSDYQTLVQRDAEDKIVRGATNDVYGALDKAGFQRLGPKDDPPIGMQALSRTIPNPTDPSSVVQERWAVPREVKAAVDHFEQRKGMTDETGLWRRITGTATKAQISGMPVEATSHMNTLASIVASVPGEKDVAGKVMAAVPGIGAKAAAIREMTGLDFSDPATRQLETRLADMGALRVETHQTGLINQSHNALFGPEGVDVRGRLVLARKYLDRKPDATDGELREFLTSKLGNYVRSNSGTLVNGLQDSGLSAFARFQAARIPGSIRSTFGASGLPATSTAQRIGDVANTLYRGPVGYAIAGQAANYAMTGHGMQDNERQHQFDVQLPFRVGANDDPTYVPMAFTNPVLATGLRATGARDMMSLPGAPNIGGKIADAGRDVVNTGLGVLSPAVRGLSIAASGRTPYMLSDGSFLRVNNNTFDKGRQAASNLRSAVSLANPAMSAFAEQGGDLGGHRLGDALVEDGKVGGGPKAIAAKAAEFIFPRVLSLGVGGRDNAMSADSRDQREYGDAMKDYTAQLRRAPGPITQERIIRSAVQDAERDGRFDPDRVEQDLRAVLEQDDAKKQTSRERSLNRWSDTHLR